jgi:chromosome segregation ATPase
VDLPNFLFYLREFAAFILVALMVGIFVGYLIWGGTALEIPADLQFGDESEVTADLRAQIETKDGEISRLRKRLKRAHADLEARDGSGAASPTALLDLETQLTARERDLEDRSLEVTSLRREIDSLHAQVTQSRAEVTDAQAEAAAAVESAQALRAEQAALRSSLGSSVSGDGSEVDPAILAELESLHDERRRLEEDVVSLRTTLSSFEKHVGDQEREIASLQRQIEGAEQRTAQLMNSSDDVEALHADLAAANDEAVRASTALARAEAEMASLRREHEELQAQALAASGSTGGSDGGSDGGSRSGSDVDDGTVARLQAELERSRSSASTWRERMAAAEEEAERLAGELAESSSRLSRLSATSTKMEASIVALQQTQGEREAALASFQEELSASTQQLASSNEQLAASTQQLAATEDELVVSRNELSALRDAIGASEEKISTLTGELARYDSLSGEYEQTAHELAQRSSEVERLHQEFASVNAELASVRNSNESQIASLHVELSDARLRADAASRELSELTTEFLTFRDTVMRQQSSFSALASRLEQAKGALGGRSVDTAASMPLVTTDREPDDLLRLPGATSSLVAYLHELGVNSFEEIGQWDAVELERYESLLDDSDGVLRQNGWVLAARELWSESSGLQWNERRGAR